MRCSRPLCSSQDTGGPGRLRLLPGEAHRSL